MMSQPCNTEDCVWYVLKKQEEDNYSICIETKRKQVEDVVVRERIYARLSVPVVRPRVAILLYIDILTDFEYNDRTFIVCTLWRCVCGNKVSKPKSHQKTIVKKNMHLLKNSDLLRCRILGRIWLTKDLIEVIIHTVNLSPCIWIFYIYSTFVRFQRWPIMVWYIVFIHNGIALLAAEEDTRSSKFPFFELTSEL